MIQGEPPSGVLNEKVPTKIETLRIDFFNHALEKSLYMARIQELSLKTLASLAFRVKSQIVILSALWATWSLLQPCKSTMEHGSRRQCVKELLASKSDSPKIFTRQEILFSFVFFFSNHSKKNEKTILSLQIIQKQVLDHSLPALDLDPARSRCTVNTY